MTLSAAPSAGHMALHGLPPNSSNNPSQQPYEAGSTMIPIAQMQKLRTERLNNLPKVTQMRTPWG